MNCEYKYKAIVSLKNKCNALKRHSKRDLPKVLLN